MHTGRFMCVRVRPGPPGLGGSVGVVGMCELMLVSAYVWEVGLWQCTSRLPAHTHTCTLGNPDTYRHTPAPSYRHTPRCRCALPPVGRLSVFLNVFLCWGQRRGSREKMFSAVPEDRGCCQTCAGTPSQLVSCVHWNSRIPRVAGSCLSGCEQGSVWEDCVTECSEMELRCDSGAQSENKSDVLPQEEMESMKAGCCGGDLAESLPGYLEG